MIDKVILSKILPTFAQNAYFFIKSIMYQILLNKGGYAHVL